MRRRQAITGLLVLLLLGQWLGAFGHCLRASAATLDLAICAVGGTPDAQPGKGKAPDHEALAVCPACSALPAVEVPPAPALASPVVWAAFAPWRPDAEAALRPPARAPPPPARAPPLPA